MTAYNNLVETFKEIAHLSQLQTISKWDEAVMMPSGGGAARAAALGTLSSIIHKKLTKPQVGEWIAEAKSTVLSSPWQQKNLYWMEKNYIDATCLPSSLVQRKTEATLRSEQAWRHLRAENNWQDFKPLLKETFSLVREAAECQAAHYKMTTYDLMLDTFAPGISQQMIDPIFNQLKSFLPSFLSQVVERQKKQPYLPLQGNFPIAKQRELGVKIMGVLGFDFNRGRLDVSHHPFCCSVPGDVRVTTRYDENTFLNSLMGVCHETGHALYEMGCPEEWLAQPVGHALGMTVHESQSLLFEMQACRSREFISYLTPHIHEFFGQHAAFTAENLYKIYTEVKPSLIRVEADEVTYPLHIILRYEIERDLVAGKITLDDLPDIWHESMQKFLGLSTKNDYRNGVMQDVHWSGGAFGYFPSYSLGAMTAAQLFHQAKLANPEILPQIAHGNFSPLLTWLRPQVHQQASFLTYNELMTAATGETLNPRYFIEHLQKRYLG